MDYKFMGRRLVALESGLIMPSERMVSICLQSGSDIAEQLSAQEQDGGFLLTNNQREFILGHFPLEDRFSSVRFSFDLDSADIIEDETLVVYVRQPLFPTVITRGR